MQIITAALMQGIVLFATVVLYLHFSNKGAAAPGQGAIAPAQAAGLPILSLVALAMLAACGAAAFLVPTAMLRGQVRALSAARLPPSPESQAAHLLAVRQTTHIIYCALFEGAAFMGLVALMIGEPIWVLAVPGISLGMIAAAFPTMGRVQGWLERQRQALEQARRDDV
jgi:hypothetical protein